MPAIYQLTSLMQETKYLGPATVLDVNEDEGQVLLQIEAIEKDFKTWGRLAIQHPDKIIIGETVLVVGEDINAFYVIGVLNSKPAYQSSKKRITMSNGAYAAVSESSGSEIFQLHAKSGEMVFEYNPETGKSSVNVQTGDLEIATKKGNIDFISEQNICFKSKQSIELESSYGIRMATKNAVGQEEASMSLRSRKIKLSSPELGVTAQRGAIHIEDSTYIGNKFSATFKHGKLIIGKLEIIANDIISKARNVYQTVDELSQLKTGRMRTLVKSTFHMKAKKSYLKADDDFKINADKIHLG